MIKVLLLIALLFVQSTKPYAQKSEVRTTLVNYYVGKVTLTTPLDASLNMICYLKFSLKGTAEDPETAFRIALLKAKIPDIMILNAADILCTRVSKEQYDGFNN